MMVCVRKRSSMTPCVVTDGPIAYAMTGITNAPICAGCERGPLTTGVPKPENWDADCAAYLAKQKRRQ